MNENMKYGLFFLGGLALGAIGAVAVSKGKLDLKPMAADLLSRGMDVKDAVLAERQSGESVPDKRDQIHPSLNIRFRRIPDGTFLIHGSLLCGGPA